MKRAFTLVEVMAGIAIVLIIAGLSYPAFASARKAARRDQCLSNLRQIGAAMMLYREREGGSDSGTPAQMGLPPNLGSLDIHPVFRCTGEAEGEQSAGYYITWPSPVEHDANTVRASKYWAWYSGKAGPAAILVHDPNHQTSLPRSTLWENWTCYGLRVDSGLVRETHLGFPYQVSWWRSK